MYSDLPSRASGGHHHRPRVAIVGSGVAGLAAAHTLNGPADVTLFEAADYFGGHAHTVDVTLPDAQGRPTTFGVDTGFLVFNERTYPQLIALFDLLNVPTAASDMSFSVQAAGAGPHGGTLEWSGSTLSTVFAQRANLGNRRFWRMLADIVRFNRMTTRLAEQEADLADHSSLMQPLGDFLQAHGFSAEFRDWYFLPMLGCIWSCPTDQMLQFPVATMIRFCHNHGLIQITNRPQWHTVAGGSRHYVDRIIGGLADVRLSTPVTHIQRDAHAVHITAAGKTERFDAVVMACHSDQSLALLGASAREDERALLGAIRYQPNQAVLHTDTSVLPRLRRAWAAWNYERSPDQGQESARVCLHYLINRLQPLPTATPVVVSLNPHQGIDPDTILGSYEYAHPVFDMAAIRAQTQLHQLQGRDHTYFAGAWMGYGFHEDGLKAGFQAARTLLEQWGLPQQHTRIRAGVAP